MVRQKIERSKLLDIAAYERRRPDIRASAMAARNLRRVHVGDMVTIGFENLETTKYQIQEMMRAERMVNDDAIDFEIATYSELLPSDDSVSATLFIEISNTVALRQWLPKLVGIEFSVFMAIDGAGTIHASGEEGRSKDDITSTVHYLRFVFSPDQVAALTDGAPVELSIRHKALEAKTILAPETATALAADLAP